MFLKDIIQLAHCLVERSGQNFPISLHGRVQCLSTFKKRRKLQRRRSCCKVQQKWTWFFLPQSERAWVMTVCVITLSLLKDPVMRFLSELRVRLTLVPFSGRSGLSSSSFSFLQKPTSNQFKIQKNKSISKWLLYKA